MIATSIVSFTFEIGVRADCATRGRIRHTLSL